YLRHHARSCQARRQYAASERHYREALALVVETGGKRHPLAAALSADLACLEVARGKPREAAPYYEQAAELFRSALGEDHPDHAAARRVLGLHLQSLGEFKQAERELLRALGILHRSAGAEHPVVALAHQPLAELHRQAGDLNAAEADYRRALDLVRRFETPCDGLHANLLHGLAMIVWQWGRPDEAAGLLGQALEIDRTSGGEEGADHLNSVLELARLQAARGEDGAALAGFRRVLAAQDDLVPVYACLGPSPRRQELLSNPWRLTESLLTVA